MSLLVVLVACGLLGASLLVDQYDQAQEDDLDHDGEEGPESGQRVLNSQLNFLRVLAVLVAGLANVVALVGVLGLLDRERGGVARVFDLVGLVLDESGVVA